MLDVFFTTNKVLDLTSLEQRGHICARKLLVGPAAHQVGGPGVVQVTPHDIKLFSSYLLAKFNLQNRKIPLQPMITLIQRKTARRRIINDGDVMTMLHKQFFRDADVQEVVLENLDYEQQLKMMSETTILIGVHGAGLTNLVFLPNEVVEKGRTKVCTVIELFPFAFTRPTYSYVAGLAGVNYMSWQNSEKKHAVFHPTVLDNYPRLTSQQRNAIINAPAFHYGMPWEANMYWISQDTIVDLVALENMVREALQK